VLPVVLLGQLTIDKRFQGQRLARQLLYYALQISVVLSGTIGRFGVITHPLDDAVRAFFAKAGLSRRRSASSRESFSRDGVMIGSIT
jgi:hypothetical protein